MLGTLVVKCQTRGEHPVYTVAFMPVDRRMGDLPELRFEGDLAVLKALERFVTTPARFLEVIKGLRDAGQSYVSDIVLSPAQTARFALHGAVARPKCTRCSRPVTDDPVIYAEEVFHTHCWQVFSSEALIVESRRRIRKGKSVIEKSRGRFERAAPALFETFLTCYDDPEAFVSAQIQARRTGIKIIDGFAVIGADQLEMRWSLNAEGASDEAFTLNNALWRWFFGGGSRRRSVGGGCVSQHVG